MQYILGLNGEKLSKKVDFIDSEVGMIRGEYLCITKRQYFGSEDFRNYFVDYLCNVAKKYAKNDVYYRMADLTTNQINYLDGVDNKFRERYYMDGYRGIRRAMRFKDELDLEISCFVTAWQKNNNLALLVPFVSRVEEVVELRKFLDQKGYTGKLAIMTETPSACMLIEEILNKVKLDRLVVGLNDLSSFMLAHNRHLSTYSVNNRASYEMIKLLMQKTKDYNIEIVLGGYIDENSAQYYEQLGIKKMIVHYHLLPKVFANLDGEHYTGHYDKINQKFKLYREKHQKIMKGLDFIND